MRRLAELNPEVAAPGHGVPMRGAEMRRQLDELAADFDRIAVPSDGRYVREPARADAGGIRSVPAPVFPPAAVLLAVGAGAAVGALTAGRRGICRP